MARTIPESAIPTRTWAGRWRPPRPGGSLGRMQMTVTVRYACGQQRAATMIVPDVYTGGAVPFVAPACPCGAGCSWVRMHAWEDFALPERSDPDPDPERARETQ